jgi:hypothetical protein
MRLCVGFTWKCDESKAKQRTTHHVWGTVGGSGPAGFKFHLEMRACSASGTSKVVRAYMIRMYAWASGTEKDDQSWNTRSQTFLAM